MLKFLKVFSILLNAMQICDKYPFGVKVRYRKYAQPEAIEIRKDSNSTDPVPLSAHIVESVWHYEEDQSGISMFAGNGPAMLRASEIRPAPFNVGSAAKYNKVNLLNIFVANINFSEFV